MSGIEILDVSCVWPAQRLLGEGPWWSETEQSLYWVDIKRPAILRYRPSDSAKDEWRSPEPIGCFAPRDAGDFIGGFKSGIYTFSLSGEGLLIERRVIATPEKHLGDDRFNDGKCSEDGSFWAGTMDDAERNSRGYFYKLDEAGQLTTISGPHMVCNGPAFSPNGRFVYLTDSALRTIFRCDLSTPGSEPVAFIVFGEADGYPDGMTTDQDGRLWIASWDGAKVICFTAEGERVMEIGLPVSRVTSCAFGGLKLDTLYITSASVGLNEDELRRQPLAGGLFAVRLAGAIGSPAHPYRG